jgi:ABC-type glycerol-3-phosphate transport system substrate-binding protein
MKKLTYVAAIILILITAVSAFGQAALKNPNVSFYRPGFTYDPVNDQWWSPGIDAFQKAYKGKVTLVAGGWDNWQAKILTRMAAGDPIDVIFSQADQFPMFYTKGYVQPLDGYVDFKKDYLNYGAMSKGGMFGGKIFIASAQTNSHTWGVIYNKDYMEEQGIDESQQPLALYLAGKWNWDSFRDLAKKLTLDTDGDGKINTYGAGSWENIIWAYSNNTSLATLDSKGKIILNFSDPRLTEAFMFMQGGVKEGWYITDFNATDQGILNRGIAMYVESEYRTPDKTRNPDVKDSFGFVPLPYGPGNAQKVNAFTFDGLSMGKGTKNPEGAGKLIELLLKSCYDADQAKIAGYAPGLQDMFVGMQKNPSFPAIPMSPINSMQWDIQGAVIGGASVVSTLEGLKPRAQAAIDDANAPLEKAVVVPFKNIAYDFEKAIDAFKIFDTSKKSVKIASVSGGDAITGKSLKISMDSSVDGEWNDALVTIPAKLPMSGWHDYKIAFDAKLLNAPPNADTYVYAKLVSDAPAAGGGKSFGWITKKFDAAGAVAHIEGTVSGTVVNSTKFGLIIGAHFGTDFVIDNLTIEEVK